MRLGGFRWAGPRLYGCTIFWGGGCDTLGASGRALNTKILFFDTFAVA